MAVTIGTMKPESVLFKGLIKLDFQYIEKLERLLEDLKENGKLAPSFNSKEGSYVIYSVVVAQFFIYIYTEEVTFDQMAANIEAQLKFIFEGKCQIP